LSFGNAEVIESCRLQLSPTLLSTLSPLTIRRHLLEEVASAKLGAKTNLSGVVNKLMVSGLLGVVLHRDSLVANVFDLIDPVSFG
jgi:hypothetical protein